MNSHWSLHPSRLRWANLIPPRGGKEGLLEAVLVIAQRLGLKGSIVSTGTVETAASLPWHENPNLKNHQSHTLLN